MNPEWVDRLQTMPSRWMLVSPVPDCRMSRSIALSPRKSLGNVGIEQRSQITDQGITTIRAKRPDVPLGIQDKVYPATKEFDAPASDCLGRGATAEG